MCIYLEDIKFVELILLLAQLYTYDTNGVNNDDDDNDDDNGTNNDNNDTQQTNHDCIGSLACMPNEPKTININLRMDYGWN